MTGQESGLALARRVLETEAAAITALTGRLDERFMRAVQILKECRGRVVVTSQGYVIRLLDTQGTGRADQAQTLLKSGTGGMGLCFDGDDLLFCGDGWLSRSLIAAVP